MTDWLQTAGRAKTWDAGSHIFWAGAPADVLLLIDSGRVKVISSAPSGKQVVLALRGPGDLLGEFAALDGGPRSASVIALTPITGWIVRAEVLVDHLAVKASAALPLLRLLVTRLREADMRRLEFGALDTFGRIAHMLEALSDQCGDDGWLHLTQAELGESVGASREATVKALTRLRAEGAIQTSRGRIRVVKPQELARVVGFHSGR